MLYCRSTLQWRHEKSAHHELSSMTRRQMLTPCIKVVETLHINIEHRRLRYLDVDTISADKKPNVGVTRTNW